MIVVDTNVVAYFFIDGDFTQAARRLWRQDRDWRLPTLWRYEYLNVLATYVRHGGAELSDALALWAAAVETLRAGEHACNMEAALTLATTHRISAYDAQYLVLADNLNTVCVTEDKRLLRTFPGRARRISA